MNLYPITAMLGRYLLILSTLIVVLIILLIRNEFKPKKNSIVLINVISG